MPKRWDLPEVGDAVALYAVQHLLEAGTSAQQRGLSGWTSQSRKEQSIDLIPMNRLTCRTTTSPYMSAETCHLGPPSRGPL